MLKVKNIKVNERLEDCENINLIIGPNNNGKTTLLNEIFNSLSGVLINDDFKWIKEIDIEAKKMKETVSNLVPNAINISSFDVVNNLKKAGYKSFTNDQGIWNGNVLGYFQQIDGDAKYKIDSHTLNNRNNEWYFWRFFVNSLTATESCDTRATDIFNSQIGDLIGDENEDILKYIFRNKNILKKIQKNIKNVFGLRVGFDNLRQGNLSFRIIPDIPIRKNGNSVEAANEWRDRSPLVKSQGHGLKAYLKIVFSLLQPYKSIVFIDEPETFLHPPQRRALGSLVAEIAKEENKQLFISTHDTEFLRGILSSEVPNIKIFYLKKKGTEFMYRSFSTGDVDQLLVNNRSNLLNERILNSFFYKKTILCEYEDDRVFYENAAALYEWNDFQDVNFIGLSGIDEVLTMFEKLRNLDLNIGMIVDIDFLIHRKFPSIINDTSLQKKFGDFKGEFKNGLNLDIENDRIVFDKGMKNFKKNGIKYIEKNKLGLLEKIKDIIKEFKQYGVYVVPVGEFESWTNVSHKNLSDALKIIQSRRKKALAKFIKDVLIK